MINLDKEHSDLAMAKQVVTDRDNSLAKISQQTDIALPTLKAYRQNPDKLDTASWSKVRALAIIGINSIVQEEVGMNTVLSVQAKVTSWFDEELHAFSDDPEAVKMIEAMKQSITSNPLELAKIAVELDK